ncbi:TetR/AcrR family transcriptional regulator [Streptococcaceae bacterium ESL0687]|nr:TetR/AcrR family transcriptional regulator [Streptococcaceae bacterium ESL0687]
MEYTKKTETTRKKIKSALISLMADKRFDQITINDIVNQAELNRSSFYRYYEDKYNLIDEMEDEILSGMKGKRPADFNYDDTDFIRENVIEHLNHLKIYAKEINCLLSDNAGSGFSEKLKKELNQSFFSNRHLEVEKNEKTSLLGLYSVDILIQTFKSFTQEDNKLSAEELADLVIDVFLNGFFTAINNS